MGDNGDLRAELFRRIDAIAPTLAADVDAGDELGRLTDTTVAALRDAGLLRLKVPAELGGFEAEPALQFEVFERLAAINAAAAWCLFIYADTAGMVTARLSDAGLARYLASGDVEVTCGGGGLRPGTLTAAPGGYLLSGTFRYGSGIHAASWVMVTGYLAAGPEGRGRLLSCVVPRAALDVADTWHVLGMRGTGSDDFSADNVFVAEELTFPPAGPPQRGGRQYRTGLVGYLAYTVPALAVALARRALDELAERASSKVRGYAKPGPLAQRAVFQAFLGEADQKLKAARALMIGNGLDLMAAVDDPDADLRAWDAEARAAAAYVVRVASDVVHDTLRFAGGDALWNGQLFERTLRDLAVAASHQLVSDSAFENHAQFLLGLPGADPMA